MSAYCTQTDVETRTPSEQLARPARLVSSVATSTDVLTLDGHGLVDDAPVTVRAESGGTLPTGLVAGTTYYAIRLTDATFQLAATAGGAAVNITTAGSNTLIVREVPWSIAITWGAAIIDDSLPAHVVPLTAPYPQTIIEVNAELAAEWLRAWSGVRSAQLDQRMAWAQQRIDGWLKHRPIRGTNAPTCGQSAIRASVSSVDSLGWVRETGRIP